MEKPGTLALEIVQRNFIFDRCFETLQVRIQAKVVPLVQVCDEPYAGPDTATAKVEQIVAGTKAAVDEIFGHFATSAPRPVVRLMVIFGNKRGAAIFRSA
jgi:hypothetical protein